MALTQLDTLFGTGTQVQQNNLPTQGLADFMSLVRDKGLATHQNYFVQIDIPRGLLADYAMYGQTLSLLCAGGEFPAVNIETRDIFSQGAVKKVATNVNFGESFLFFYLESDMTLKTFIDDWLRLIYNPIDGIVGFPDDIQTNIRVYQLDKQGIPTYGIEMRSAFPKATFPLQITSQGATLHRLPVSFTYRSWANINVQYQNQDGSGFWGNLLSSQGMGLINKVAPVLMGVLMK